MNPQNPSREDIELRITMLLLGELPAAEAEALHQMIARDAALKKLHDELEATIGLVREMEKSPADAVSENSAGLKLSDERREKLLAHFQTPRPQESFWIRPLKLRPLIPALAIVALLVALLGATMVEILGSRSRSSSLRADVQQQDVLAETEKVKSELQNRTWSADNTDREKVNVSGQVAAIQPAPVSVPPEPVLAPPPAPAIVLPSTEAPAAVFTSSLADSGKGGVYSQNIVGYTTVTLGSSTLTTTPAAPVVVYGIQPAGGDQSVTFHGGALLGPISGVPASAAEAKPADALVQDAKVLYEAGKLEESEYKLGQALAKNPDDQNAQYYLNLDKQATYARDLNNHRADTQTRMEQVEKQWVAPKGMPPSTSDGQIVGVASASGGTGGLRNTGSGGSGGGGGSGGAFQWNIGGTLRGYYDDGSSKPGKDAETRLALDDSAANRLRTENGPINVGAEMRPAAPASAAGATVTYDAFTLAAVPAPDSSPALVPGITGTTYSGGLQSESGEKKYGSEEITKGAFQLHSSEPASSSRSRVVKITPLPGARAAVGETENNAVGLALNTAPAETPPPAEPRPTQMRATAVRTIINDVGFAQATDTSNDGDGNGLTGKKLERSPARQQVIANGAIDSFTTPPAATAVPLLGDVPAAGQLFVSGAGEAGANRADKSSRWELALNGASNSTTGTDFASRKPAVVTLDSLPASSMKESQRLPGISAAAAGDAEYERQLVQAQRQSEVRAANAGNTTLGASQNVSQNSWKTGLAKDDVAGLRYITATNAVETSVSQPSSFAFASTEFSPSPTLSQEQRRQIDVALARPDITKEELDSLKQQLADAKNKDLENAAKFQPYYAEKRKLQDLEETHKMLSLKLTANSIDAKIPTTSMVQITDLAQPNSKQTFWQSMRGEYASTAKVKVENDGGIINGFATAAAQNQPYDPYFIQTTFEIMKSELVLGKVVDDLHLETAWANKNGGQKLSKQRAIELLKSRVSLQPIKNTKLVAISMTGDKPEEAAKLANAVAQAYVEYRVANNQQTAQTGLEVLRQEYTNEEKQIDEIRLNLASMETKPAQQAEPVKAVEQADAPVRRAPVNAPVPQPEILTSENAFSTFSLNVSDVSFKLAEASLEKGQMPDAAGIRSEEFINAFDYRDPEAPAGQPLAFASERARYPFAHNRELLRFSIKTAAAGRPAGRALNLVLLLDNSGSMERADRVAIIREALHVLAGQLQPQDTVSVVTFARTARLWADGVAGDKAGETLAQVGDITPEGGTNLEEAMRLAYETARRHYLASGMNRVVLLTDGAANLGNVDPAALKQKVEAQRKQGIALDCFGIGFEGYDDDLLEQLSRNGDGRYAFINSPEEAGKEFAAKLAGALQIAASDVKVQVEFNPARVISYRQIGYAKHQLTKEQFRDNTVDAAEIAAQEAGNALYTVETKPDGTGPVATVHVRYKVPGTMDYQERSWDVAYEGNVPALEQASAAMRLAGTASAFSEWLAVSPFAQEVAPDDLLKIISGVPEIYGADERPKKLEWMIRQAKSLSGK